MKNITKFVQAKFKPVGKEVTVKVPTGEFSKGLFGGQKEIMRKETRWEQTGWSDKEIDGWQLQEDVQSEITELNDNDYEIVSITPITSANYNWEKGPQGDVGGYGYGYGYSYTEGVMIVAKKA